MKNWLEKYKNILIESILFVTIIVLGSYYIHYIWLEAEKEKRDHILKTAQSIEILLPHDYIYVLEAVPTDIIKPAYTIVKNSLQNVISINKDARFAYVYKKRGSKLYFLADSEPENSPDCSPPGQEYSEATTEDFNPFVTGKEWITTPLTDRWGTWVSVLIPIKDQATNKVIAVYGMDFDASTWKMSILKEISQPTIITLALLGFLVLFIKLSKKNHKLNNQIKENQIAQQQNKLQNQKLTELNATKDKFFSIIAHDLRNPFNAMFAISEQILDNIKIENPTSETQQMAQSLHILTNQTLKLLENLLEWSKIQRGLITPNLTENNLKIMIYEMCYLNKRIAESKNITLKNNVLDDIFAYCDTEMSKTILRNIVSNAIKYTHNGGTIEIYCELKNTFIEIRVTDTGVGISESAIQNLFRIDKSTSTRGTADEKGSGIGLLLCKELSEMQGGKIWVDSEIGKGSTFYIQLKNGNTYTNTNIGKYKS